ncbi:MAG: exopolysaccharide biosynthesis polyprenyl glycosylphosphotransferase [Hyphomonadaceae bacterium]|nr:exopolysaccharide biosynthesis polyprenyl glycosylphosphotransferase [Hyphomonadaceae bacterium]
MSTRVIRDVETKASAVQAERAAAPKTLKIPVNNAVHVNAARLPSRRIPLRFAGIRFALKWLDIIVAGLISSYFLLASGAGFLFASVYQFTPFALIPVVLSWSLRTANAYNLGFNRGILDHVLTAAYGSGIPLAVLGLGISLIYQQDVAPFAVTAIFATWLVVNCIHIHVLVIGRHLARAGWISENVVIVGATENAQRLIERNAKTRELNIVGIFDDRLSRAPISMSGAPLLGRLDDLFDWGRLPEIDRVIVTVTSDARHRVRSLIDRLRILPQRVVLLLDLDGFDPETESLAKIAHSPAAYVSGSPHDARRAVSKRVFDVVLASLMLVAFSPILLALAMAIKLESKGPVIFRQKRHGFNNQIIRVWKFRSMYHDPLAAERISQQTIADDPRITRIGRLIRQTSIDELPQLWNVLKGEMSIVGPRPHAVGMTSEEQEVQNIVGDYAHRHRAKPGITGWAQINGSRGPVHTKELVRERVRLDMEYVNRSSFWFDCYIMLMTLPRLFGDATRVR